MAEGGMGLDRLSGGRFVTKGAQSVENAEQAAEKEPNQ